MELLLTVIYWIVGACLAVAAVLAAIRIVRGPSIVDRMVGSDTFATILICYLGADMAIRGHTTTLPLMLGLAMTASVGAIAVARFVSRDRPRDQYPAEKSGKRGGQEGVETTGGLVSGVGHPEHTGAPVSETEQEQDIIDTDSGTDTSAASEEHQR